MQLRKIAGILINVISLYRILKKHLSYECRIQADFFLFSEPHLMIKKSFSLFNCFICYDQAVRSQSLSNWEVLIRVGINLSLEAIPNFNITFPPLMLSI
jgi:hypothetical protein